MKKKREKKPKINKLPRSRCVMFKHQGLIKIKGIHVNLSFECE